MIENLIRTFGLDRKEVIQLLPSILSEIRNYTNQYFLTTTHSSITKIEEGKIYTESTAKFKKDNIVEIINSENAGIYIIKNVETDYIEVEEYIEDEINPNSVMIKLQFNQVSIKTVTDMVNHIISFAETTGIQSQSLGGYIISYSQPTGGETIFPLELYGGLNSLRKLHDDFAEYRRKGYVRI